MALRGEINRVVPGQPSDFARFEVRGYRMAVLVLAIGAGYLAWGLSLGLLYFVRNQFGV